ncbi:hypothetical protein BGZ73_002645 [Actinomortierella ambigua]|nr:hypothetical protein BGZ73_002645 [Actinomortierella ambigua]
MPKRQGQPGGREPEKAARLDEEVDEVDDMEELGARIAADVFGRPTLAQHLAVGYFVAMRWAPKPVQDDMVSKVRSALPDAKTATLSSIWRRMSEYFSPENEARLDHLTAVMDVSGMVAAFAGTAKGAIENPSLRLPTSKSSASQSGSAPSTSSSSSRATGSKSSTSSTSSNGKLSASALLHLRTDFDKNFKKFSGEPWVLSSGTVVDDVLASWAQKMAIEQGAESELHSFIIEDVKGVLMAFEDEADKAEVQAVLERRSGEPLQELCSSESAYLELFAKDPKGVAQLLRKSWEDISLDPPESNPEDDFRSLTHHWMKHLYLVYQTRDFRLPDTESESWFTNMLWGPMALILDTKEGLQYKHGEYTSASSTLRKQIEHERGRRQAVGRKADGMILGASTGLEICVLETAKKDDGPRSTKARHDTLKLAKFTKDMVDVMRAEVAEEVQSQLVAYALRVAAGSMHLYTFQQLNGRFGQLFYEAGVTFPPTWNALTAKKVTSVVGQVMALRKELACYDSKLALMVENHKASSESIKPIIPTICTPVCSPKARPTSTSA